MRLIESSYVTLPQRDARPLPVAWKMVGLIFFTFLAVIIICPGVAAATPAGPYDSLDAAVRVMTGRLVQKARRDLGDARKDIRRVIAVDLFVDGGTGEVPLAGLEIERIVAAEAQFRFTEFDVVGFTSKTVAKTDYWIGGIIVRTISESGGPCFRIEGTLKDVWSGSEISRVAVLVPMENFDTTPMAIYKESPLYDLAGFRTNRAGDLRVHQPSSDYSGYTLETRALLMDAARAYEKADFKLAKTFLEKAVELSDTHRLSLYNGLYLVNRQLGRSLAAAQAMKGAIAVSIEEHGMLMVRLVFEKNSAVFPTGPTIRDTYLEWLGHIGAYFRQTKDCLRIVGHASRTGSESWNALLSRQRAKFIQKKLKIMLPDVMARSEAIGIGSQKNLVGIGTDDNRDAPDRRVEIVIIDCKKLQTQ